jgi:hypothetical protein
MFGEPGDADLIYPSVSNVDSAVPKTAGRYLAQAFETLHAPDGAALLAASAVDAMLKEKGLIDGSFYARIEAAVEASIITRDMALWAHTVRLDANDVRHADVKSPHRSRQEAEQLVEFARSLADFMFVLPSRVRAGLQAAEAAKKRCQKNTDPRMRSWTFAGALAPARPSPNHAGPNDEPKVNLNVCPPRSPVPAPRVPVDTNSNGPLLAPCAR